MTNDVLVAVPIKPFGVAKARLGPWLDPEARAALGRAIAARTVSVAREVVSGVAVVTGDEGVARWAGAAGASVIAEGAGGLDEAAASAVKEALGRSMKWAVIHADLPLLTPSDLDAVMRHALEGRLALAPSHDGGTNIVAGATPFRFSYGPGSFHRHLRMAADLAPAVVTRVGTAVDLDTGDDLARVLAHPAGAWIGSYLP